MYGYDDDYTYPSSNTYFCTLRNGRILYVYHKTEERTYYCEDDAKAGRIIHRELPYLGRAPVGVPFERLNAMLVACQVERRLGLRHIVVCE